MSHDAALPAKVNRKLLRPFAWSLLQQGRHKLTEIKIQLSLGFQESKLDVRTGESETIPDEVHDILVGHDIPYSIARQNEKRVPTTYSIRM